MLTALTHTTRRRALSLGLSALVAVTFAGCTVPTPYQPYGVVRPRHPLLDQLAFRWTFAGGYWETELADDQYAICFIGLADNNAAKTTYAAASEDIVRLRAAEITLEQNYTHFVIESDKHNIVHVDWECGDTYDCDGYDDALVTLHIKLLKSPDSSVPGAINAKSLYDSLAPIYKKPLSPSYINLAPGFTCGEQP